MSTLAHPERELSDLYRALSEPLVNAVRRDVRAPDPVIEDACQFAWTRLIYLHGRVTPEATLTWLARTAVREAVKLIRRDGREQSLELGLETGLDHAGGATPHDLAEQHERLRLVDSLPDRQQRFVWLQALGFSYTEIALHTGSSERTVERQLLRAKRGLRAVS